MGAVEHGRVGARQERPLIELATADHLVIMGCDDIMLPNYVAHMSAMIAKDPDAAFYHSGSEIIDAEGAVVHTLVDTAKAYYRPRVKQQTAIGGERLATSLMRGVWTNFPAIAWRREVIASIGFDARFVTVQDIALERPPEGTKATSAPDEV